MDADLHIQQDPNNSGEGNLFAIFGKPAIDNLRAPDNNIQLKINGVDAHDPSTDDGC